MLNKLGLIEEKQMQRAKLKIKKVLSDTLARSLARSLTHSPTQTNDGCPSKANNIMVYLNDSYILKAYFWNCHKIFMCLNDINGWSSLAAVFRKSSEERRWAAVKT